MEDPKDFVSAWELWEDFHEKPQKVQIAELMHAALEKIWVALRGLQEIENARLCAEKDFYTNLLELMKEDLVR